jgi:hypothetical protein
MRPSKKPRWSGSDVCARASAFSVIGRYPGIAAEPMDEDQLEALLREAEALVDEVERALG